MSVAARRPQSPQSDQVDTQSRYRDVIARAASGAAPQTSSYRPGVWQRVMVRAWPLSVLSFGGGR